jgi:hypothetical protein
MLINGREYAWADVYIGLFGRVIIGTRGINYIISQELKHLHGKGRKALDVTRGRETCSGSITLLQSEIEAIMLSIPAGVAKKLSSLAPTDITITYQDSSGILVNDVCKGVVFSDLKKGMMEGDGNSEHELPFLCKDIILQSATSGLNA